MPHLHTTTQELPDGQVWYELDAGAWFEVAMHEQHTIGGIALHAGDHLLLHFVRIQLLHVH